MCIAVIKPKGANFPTREQFKNCFDSNPHGAGFMYSNGKELVIKKGLMTFDDFYNTFLAENLSKDKLVFFHFRISTQYDEHNVVDTQPCNTHPFPITGTISELRKTEHRFNGYGLMHNGIIMYNENEYQMYGTTSNSISDTMLLCLRLNNVLEYLNNDIDKLTEFVDCDAGFYNKVAIMNVAEEYIKIGSWIENNGVYYSNMTFEPFRLVYNKKNHTFYNKCFVCGKKGSLDEMYDTHEGFVCEGCKEYFDLYKCDVCGKYLFADEVSEKDVIDKEERLVICSDCQNYYDICYDDDIDYIG